MRRFWADVVNIVRKDLSMELRGKEIFSTTLLFALLVMVIFNFAFDMTAVRVEDVAAGVLWVAILFSGALSMNRSFLYEKEDGCLHALMLAPVDRSAIYFGKAITNFVLTMAGVVFIVPILIVLFNVNVMERFFWQSAALLLGTMGFVSVGTLISAMSVNLRAREMMGPLLMFPVVAPVVIAAVKASGGLVRGEPLEALAVWFKILLVFDVVYLVLPWLVFEHIIEE
ncbi:MAG: heme exporter protein CcmB [Candidatus Nitrospinota bacterium M3_3B_026]